MGSCGREVGWLVHGRGVPTGALPGNRRVVLLAAGILEWLVFGLKLEGSWLEGETLGDHCVSWLESRMNVMGVRCG